MAQQLARVQPGTNGIRRQRTGRGYSYLSANGRRIHSQRILDRIDGLAIPPAWNDVWIASGPSAHIQATGLDAAGRLQYIYHPQWREIRDQEKFIRSLAFAQRLPTMRRGITRDLKNDTHPRARALAAAVRLMDVAGLRVGGAAYAAENGSFGATTLRKRHVQLDAGTVHLKFRGKSAGAWDVTLQDELLAEYFSSVPRTPGSAPAICHPVVSERRKTWKAVSDTEVNAYLGEIVGHGFTAKDFRTWQGTVVAARSLARARKIGATSPEASKAALQEAATWLHNTPAVARDSYVNPRVIDLFERGVVANLSRQPDKSVLSLLMDGSGDQHE
ncbi:DNA topoisomerase IB [Paeniglutamicibacter antarcticus]|uniref:DNA topoisomerase n=1 Tax=Paeniglutamicibacter antarcticus TaxID=494023 RepID=A0ABP9TL07_9MICC